MFFRFINSYNIKQSIFKTGIQMFANIVYTSLMINIFLTMILVLGSSLEAFKVHDDKMENV